MSISTVLIHYQVIMLEALELLLNNLYKIARCYSCVCPQGSCILMRDTPWTLWANSCSLLIWLICSATRDIATWALYRNNIPKNSTCTHIHAWQTLMSLKPKICGSGPLRMACITGWTQTWLKGAVYAYLKQKMVSLNSLHWFGKYVIRGRACPRILWQC